MLACCRAFRSEIPGRRPVVRGSTLILLFFSLLAGCQSGEQSAELESEIGEDSRAFRLEFGIADPRPADWSGRLQSTTGNVLRLDPWHFSEEDQLLSENSWSARSRIYGPRIPSYYEYPTRNLPFEDDELIGASRAYSRLIAPGLVITAARGTALRVETAQGDFELQGDSLSPGQPRLLLNGRVQAQDVPVHQLLTGTDTFDDFPCVLSLPDGEVQVGWIEYQNEGQRILARRLQRGRWSRPLELRAAQDLDSLQAISGADNRIWWIWSEQREDNWDLYARWSRQEELGPVLRLTEDPQPDLYPRAASNGGGAWLAWQGFREGQSDILLKRLDGEQWSAGETRISPSQANDWRPALAVDGEGNAYVAWDSYERGDYDIFMRRVSEQGPGPLIPVAQSRRFEAYPDLLCDRQGRLWVAWNETGSNWGKDTGFWVDRSRATFNQERTIRLAVYQGGRWSEPVTALPEFLEQYFSSETNKRLSLSRPPRAGSVRFRNDNELPRLAADGQGRIWLFFRHQAPGAGNTSSYRPVWELYATSYQGDSWSDPVALPLGLGRLDMPLSVSAMEDGPLWLAWLTDHRSPHETSSLASLQEDVVLGRWLTPRENRDPLLQERNVPIEPIESYHPNEEQDVVRIRNYRIQAGDRSFQIVRGDMHRHTDFSRDGALDSSLDETYRYALDAAALDFLAVTDHFPEDYAWWQIQKATDRFHLTGSFVPLVAYERNLSYPNGHRNLVFPKRGVPVLPRTPEENDGRISTGSILYDHLRQYGGISMPHTSGTPTMGTDWRDNADDVEPLVEIFQGDRISYEYPGAPLAGDPADPSTHRGGYLEEGFVWKAWKKGYRLGVQASSDHWSMHFSYACLLVERLDREGLMDAMRRRHAYAATDNIVLDLQMRDGGSVYIMGDAFETSSRPVLKLHAQGTDVVQEAVVIRDNRIVYTQSPGTARVDFTYADADPSKGTHFYYARILQKNGQVAWSSPIWVTYR